MLTLNIKFEEITEFDVGLNDMTEEKEITFEGLGSGSFGQTIATKQILGSIIVGDRLDIETNGRLHAQVQFEPLTSDEILQILKG